MIPIPKHMREFAVQTACEKDKIKCSLKCTCGYENFLLYKNVKPRAALNAAGRERKRISDLWWREFEKTVPDDCEYFANVSDNSQDIWVFKKADMEAYEKQTDKMIADGTYTKFFAHTEGMEQELKKLGYKAVAHIKRKENEPPYEDFYKYYETFDTTDVLKVVCSDCGKEYLLFDSRLHGNDAIESEPDDTQYKFKQKLPHNVSAPRVSVIITNYWDFDDIASNGNEELTADDYSELFHYISVYAVLPDGKKSAILTRELG